MSLVNTVYNTFFRRTSTFVATFVVVGVIAEQTFEMSADNFYDRLNKGKLWKDIAPKEQ